MFSRKTKLFAVGILVAMTLLPVSAAFANSGPPPTTIWLFFEYQTTAPTALEG